MRYTVLIWPDPSAESQGGKWFLEPPGVLREILGFKSLKKFILKVCLRSGNRTLAFSASLHFCRHGGGSAHRTRRFLMVAPAAVPAGVL